MNIYSKLFPGTILHIINRWEEIPEGRRDLVDVKQFIQVATIKQPQGKTFAPHHHLWGVASGSKITQESWVVVSGKVEVTFYDLDNKPLHTDILNAGDCSITLQGGHNYKFLEDGVVYEFKTGPYFGHEADKAMI